MTVLILIQNLRIGGIQRLAIDEANECLRRGYKVFVISFEPTREADSMRDFLRIPKQNYIFISYSRLRSVRGLFRLIRTLGSIRPDILITHHWFANTVGRMAAMFACVPIVYSFEHSIESTRRPRRQFFLDQILQRKSTFVIAISESVQNSLLRHGIHAEKIRTIANGIYMPPWNSPPLGPGNRFICIGRLVRDKAIDIALSALSKVEGTQLTIVGDGPERGRLEKQAYDLALSKRVRFIGFSSNPVDELKRADCLLMPSRREGFGIAALEALAAGVPVIASSVVGTHGIVKNNVNGLIVPTNDIEALAHAMKQFVEDAILRKRLAVAAPRGLEPYSIQAHVDALLALA